MRELHTFYASIDGHGGKVIAIEAEDFITARTIVEEWASPYKIAFMSAESGLVRLRQRVRDVEWIQVDEATQAQE